MVDASVSASLAASNVSWHRARYEAQEEKGSAAASQPSARPKISQSLWEFAGDFIRMGDTLEQRQSYLNAACSAWNIACNMPEATDAIIGETLDGIAISLNAGAERVTGYSCEEMMGRPLSVLATTRTVHRGSGDSCPHQEWRAGCALRNLLGEERRGANSGFASYFPASGCRRENRRGFHHRS